MMTLSSLFNSTTHLFYDCSFLCRFLTLFLLIKLFRSYFGSPFNLIYKQNKEKIKHEFCLTNVLDVMVNEFITRNFSLKTQTFTFVLAMIKQFFIAKLLIPSVPF